MIFVFSLANSSDAFILLRAKELGYSLLEVLVALLNIVSAATVLPAASLSDKVGRRFLIALGWGTYALSYAILGLGISDHHGFVFVATVGFYGLFSGFTDSVERAWIAEMAPSALRGRAYGIFGLIAGLSALPKNAGFGWAWDRWGSAVPFLACSTLALFAIALLYLLMPPAIRRGDPILSS